MLVTCCTDIIFKECFHLSLTFISHITKIISVNGQKKKKLKFHLFFLRLFFFVRYLIEIWLRNLEYLKNFWIWQKMGFMFLFFLVDYQCDLEQFKKKFICFTCDTVLEIKEKKKKFIKKTHLFIIGF